jgi:hypothetical protein
MCVRACDYCAYFSRYAPIKHTGPSFTVAIKEYYKFITHEKRIFMYFFPKYSTKKPSNIFNKKTSVFIGTFKELRNATVSFVIGPSVRPHVKIRLPLDGFSRNLMYGCFEKMRGECFSLKSDKNNGYFT